MSLSKEIEKTLALSDRTGTVPACDSDLTPFYKVVMIQLIHDAVVKSVYMDRLTTLHQRKDQSKNKRSVMMTSWFVHTAAARNTPEGEHHNKLSRFITN